MALFVNIYTLYIFFNCQWLNSGVINSILVELAKLLSGMQMMLFEKAYLYFYKLKINNIVPPVDIIET